MYSVVQPSPLIPERFLSTWRETLSPQRSHFLSPYPQPQGLHPLLSSPAPWESPVLDISYTRHAIHYMALVAGVLPFVSGFPGVSTYPSQCRDLMPLIYPAFPRDQPVPHFHWPVLFPSPVWFAGVSVSFFLSSFWPFLACLLFSTVPTW